MILNKIRVLVYKSFMLQHNKSVSFLWEGIVMSYLRINGFVLPASQKPISHVATFISVNQNQKRG